MKTKLEMAHEYALQLSKNPSVTATHNDKDIASRAWQYADAMQAEADKRGNKTRPEVLMAVQQTFINGIEQPRYATSMGDQKRTPKVSRFERSDAVKEVLSRAENMGLIKPKAVDEWQPDWSQAPDNALTWAINSGGYASWALYKDGHYFSTVQAPPFGYTGGWRNSLRKRPE